ncbi:MAG: cytochrome c-type biogenesis protein [Polaromonas sp.]
MRKLFLACLLILAAVTSYAREAPTVAADPVLEKRVMALSSELRCLVCQNQTIADSNAELAIDLRNQVREKLGQGMSDKDVIDYMVQRYGDFVLYRPPVKSTTWLLWFGPFLLLVVGLFFLGLKLSRRPAQVDALPESEMQRAAQLLRPATDMKEKE